MGLFGTKIRVTYIDADTDAVIMAENVKVRHLPETYTYESVVRVKGHDCQVVRAMPRNKPEFIKEGTLLLLVRRVDLMQPKHRVFGYPSLCTDMAEPGKQPTDANTVRIKQDHWRQLELISQDLLVTVNNELKQIRMVMQHARTEMGYKSYYARRRPTIPVTSGIKLSVITGKFGMVDKVQSLAVDHSRQAIDDGFAFEVDKGCHMYGLAPHGEVLMLAISPICTVGMRGTSAQKVKAIAEEFQLELVDWANGRRYEPQDSGFIDCLTS